MRRIVFSLGLALAVLTFCADSAAAQTVAAGPYYATPSWDQTIPCTAPTNCSRFVVLSNFDSAAVLDRDTGLIWQRTPIFQSATFQDLADLLCKENAVGGRYGWRLPRLAELFTLADPTNSAPAVAHLPPGHPFLGNASTGAGLFWSSDLKQNGSAGFAVDFQNFDSVSMTYFPGATADQVNPNSFVAQAWCVRAAE